MTDKSMREAIDEVWALFKATDARIEQQRLETEAQFRETSEKFRETAEQMRETAEQMRETDERLRGTDERLRMLDGLFTGQWGKMLEALVKPGALRLFQDRGVDVRYTYQRPEAQLNGHTMEIDLLLENGSEIVVVEVKSTLKVEDVREFLVDLDQFLDFFPQHRDKAVYGAVAGLTIEESADRFAYRQGLFVLSVMGDGLVQILNDNRFQPTDFGASRRN